MEADRRRVAITGVGIVSALGPDRETSFARLVSGDSGIAEVSSFELGELRSRLAAEVPAPRSAVSGSESRTDALAVRAALEALAHGALPTTHPLALVVGGTTGGMFEAERYLARCASEPPGDCASQLLSYPLSTTAARLRERLSGVERAVTVCSACSSGANAVVIGAAWIRTGVTQAALVGGSDGLCRLTYWGFNALGVVAAEPCRPFDAHRAGLTLGEGAAFLLLESEAHARARGARVVAWVSGFSVGAEAHHITHPEPSGRTSVRLLRSALEQAGLSPTDVDYVNAHGTATPQNDEAEARALAAVLGPELERVRVSSSKGQVGHALGAAGAMEAAFTALACERSVAPPTVGLIEPDPELPLRHVRGRGEPVDIRAALSSSFGFGGVGTVLAFERAERPGNASPLSDVAVVLTALATFGPRGELSGVRAAEYLEDASVLALPAGSLMERLDPARSRRFDRASALVVLGAERVLEEAALDPELVGLCLGSAFGNVERSVEFLERVFERGPRFASPAEFPHLVPSAAGGNASIYLGLSGPVLTVSDVAASSECALAVASALIRAGLADAMVVGTAEPKDAVIERVLAPMHGHSRASQRGEGAAFLLLERRDRALARGRHPMARFDGQFELRELSALAAPGAHDRAVVVSAADEHELERWLGASAWQGVTRRRVHGRGVPPEMRGGLALVAAAAALARGDHDEALVVGCGRGASHATLLTRVPSDGVA